MVSARSQGWSRVRRMAVIGIAIAVSSIAISAVALATLGTGSSVTLCVSDQHTVRVLGGTSACKGGEQAVKVYTKGGADARFALKPKAHTSKVYEDESSCDSAQPDPVCRR